MQAGLQTLSPEYSAVSVTVSSCPVLRFGSSLTTASIAAVMLTTLTFSELTIAIHRCVPALHLFCWLSLAFVLKQQIACGNVSVETEFWFTVSFDNQPVGFEHVKVQPITGRAAPLLSCFRKTELNLTRLNQNLTVKASLWTTQTPDGILQSFRLQRTDGNGSRIERSGTVGSDRSVLHLEERIGGTRRNWDLRIPAETYSPIVSVWLPAAAETAQGRLSVPVFFPESSVISEVTAARMPNRRLRLPGNSSLNARRFQFALQLDPTNLTDLLTDDAGNVVRQEKQVLHRTLVLEATTAEQALSAASRRTLDLDAASLIPIQRLPAAGTGRRITVLEVTVTEGFLTEIPNSSYQKADRISPSITRITLAEPGGRQSLRIPKPPVAPPPLSPTRWMPTDDSAVQRMALLAVGSETDPSLVCQKLETYVRQKMRHSAFSTSLLPASEVARTLKGDCTEHAVLLATLIRARGISARIATGLIHTDRQLGFAGHVWVEASIDDTWEPFDSAVDARAPDTTRIKLGDSQMPDTLISGASLFLPMLELAGRSHVQVLETR